MAFLFSDLELILAGSGARQCWIAGGGAGPVESDRKTGKQEIYLARCTVQ